MTIWMWSLFTFLVIQRLAELLIARNNETWMKTRGAYEVGENHYKWFILTHSLFFVAILGESLLRSVEPATPSLFLFSVFIVTQLFRIWCIASLGKYWNTKIIVLPGTKLVSKGPYRFIKHPNYLVVLVELIIIPLLFQAYLTAVIFPLLHLLLLRIRIPEEEKALKTLSP